MIPELGPHTSHATRVMSRTGTLWSKWFFDNRQELTWARESLIITLRWPLFVFEFSGTNRDHKTVSQIQPRGGLSFLNTAMLLMNSLDGSEGCVGLALQRDKTGRVQHFASSMLER